LFELVSAFLNLFNLDFFELSHRFDLFGAQKRAVFLASAKKKLKTAQRNKKRLDKKSSKNKLKQQYLWVP
jgi:hypothetical protein